MQQKKTKKTMEKNGKKTRIYDYAGKSNSKNTYPQHTYSVLVQDFVSGQVEACCVTEPVSLRVTIATSCDAVNSHNRQDLTQSLVPTYYVYMY